MIVTFISQCEKKAIPRTRRVLDAFAERIGDNTWQTVITEEGLIAVKKLLRKTVTKNTAVSCHWIRSRRRTELLWIVGNRNKFNSEGVVPVNRTQKSFNEWETPHLWQNLELIAVAVAIAGLFHDVGKANNLFQAKLQKNSKDSNGRKFEAYRHEWVSLRIFTAFTCGKSDDEWIAQLNKPYGIDKRFVITHLYKDGFTIDLDLSSSNIFNGLSDFAKLIAWLIVSHHRLLTYPFSDDFQTPPALVKEQKYQTLGDYWLNKEVGAEWNAKNHYYPWSEQDKQDNWSFHEGLPFASKEWHKKAQEIAKRAIQIRHQIITYNWQNDLLTAQLARMLLVQADHHYSAQPIPETKWQDLSYAVYANTDREGRLKQKLDEHNIGVAHHGYLFTKNLPKFLSELPTLGVNRILERGIAKGDPELSRWQNEAVKIARSINIKSNEYGFFGINMASTGKGKTFANARIMYALADEENGCRFNIALGLRTLTLQTGKALKENLKLGGDEIATLIGSSAIQRLFSADKNDEIKKQELLLKSLELSPLAQQGSESLVDDFGDMWVDYFDIEPQGMLKKWFHRQPKAQKLLHAPILVSTIDHLIPATESTRGGRHIVPMLRLLRSDLVLDEPDELNLEDLPALCRLVNFTGLLGGKVLLSSATIPPAMACALFGAYKAGREIYQASMSASKNHKPIVCAWFDEFSSSTTECIDVKQYLGQHNAYVNKRIKRLSIKEHVSHRAQLIDIIGEGNAIQRLSHTIQNTIFTAHNTNLVKSKQGVNVSFGIVRFANINTLVKVVRALSSVDLTEEYCFHLCVYHSRFTLAQRSDIEEKLDELLNRKQPEDIWEREEIVRSIAKMPQVKNHIFIVFATSVAEVGRDHDYDWAIAEPSSMRSLVQLAGRVQRHRKNYVTAPNIFILEQNYLALKGDDVCYQQPGFESKERKLEDNSLKKILKPKQYEKLNAIPSIEYMTLSLPPFENLVALEQNAYWMTLFGWGNTDNYAALWWKDNVTWFGELQRRQCFRKSGKDITLFFTQDERGKKVWKIWSDLPPYTPIASNLIVDGDEMQWGNNVFNWFELDEEKRYLDIVEKLDMDLDKVYQQYGEVRLPDNNKSFYYHPFLGIYNI